MIAKKNRVADLERKRFAFFQIGLIVAGASTLVAFEYVTSSVQPPESIPESPALICTEEFLYEDQPQPKEQQEAVSVQSEPIDDVTISTSPADATIVQSNEAISIEGIPDGELIVNDELIPEDDIEVPDIDPQFPGGYAALSAFIRETIRYPEIPRSLNIQGTVYVEFVVNLDGSVSQVTAKNSVDPHLEKEAIRVIRAVPRWIPGEKKGKPVRSFHVIPIRFVIQP